MMRVWIHDHPRGSMACTKRQPLFEAPNVRVDETEQGRGSARFPSCEGSQPVGEIDGLG